ncbi:LysR family transcriptional regulator [Oceanisphaera avium]|uniref:HTH lysR-type domain-containing protein n=1 Tax=Oceanisphaera avium TaxID=1903694 RepID=A0A1Y0CUR3_9GAMM|nr:LysR substrate-binding domain-containing protein [Oceanisphaera avium]ART79081.1 hypothetical protein CBP12_02075 [Oceanisphaera avium]
MQLAHIHLLHAILQTGSLTGAADLLHISQPAASKRLQQAERELGFALFYREKGRLIASPQALQLQAPTEQIAREVQRLTQLAHSLAPQRAAALRIICTPTLAQRLLPLAFTSWRTHYPEMQCSLGTEHTQGLIEALLTHRSDLGLTLRRVSHPSVRSTALIQGQMQVLALVGAWPDKQSKLAVSLAQLSGKKLIGLEDKEGLGGLLETHLQRLAPPVRIAIRVQTYQLARHMVTAGQGIAIVDPFTAAQASPSLSARALTPSIPVTLYSVSRKNEVLNASQQFFIEQVQQQAHVLLS